MISFREACPALKDIFEIKVGTASQLDPRKTHYASCAPRSPESMLMTKTYPKLSFWNPIAFVGGHFPLNFEKRSMIFFYTPLLLDFLYKCTATRSIWNGIQYIYIGNPIVMGCKWISWIAQLCCTENDLPQKLIGLWSSASERTLTSSPTTLP